VHLDSIITQPINRYCAVESPSPRGWVCICRVLNEVSVALLLKADAGDSNKMTRIQPYEDNHRLLCDRRKCQFNR
jgi:hypothetical protein